MAENFCFHSENLGSFIAENFKGIRAPFGAGIELTAKCNLNCVHCYAKPDRVHMDMSTDEFKNIVDTLIDKGMIEVYLTGGEIFTRPDFEEIYVYIKKKGVLLSLLTNLTLLSDRHIELFKQYPVETISSSIYGCTEDTYESVTGVKGSFDKFIKALDMLKNNDIPFELKFITLKQNYSDLDKIEDFSQKYNVLVTVYADIHAANDGSDSPIDYRISLEDALLYDTIAPNMLKHWDNLAKGILDGSISLYPKRATQRFSEGYLYPCLIAYQEVYITSDCKMQGCVRVPYYQYDLRKGNFDEGWEYLKRMTLDRKAKKSYKCLTCKNTRFCQHCVGKFMLLNGSEEEVDPYTCMMAEQRKELVFNKIKEYNKGYEKRKL